MTTHLARLHQHRPIFLCPTDIRADYTVYHLADREIKVTLPRRLSRELLHICDGTVSIAEILGRLRQHWCEDSLRRVFQVLTEHGVLRDSGDMSDLFLQFTENPSPWSRPLTDHQLRALVEDTSLHDPGTSEVRSLQPPPRVGRSPLQSLLAKRRSIRRFAGAALTEAQLAAALWSSYGTCDRVVHGDGDGGHNAVLARTVPSAGALYPCLLHAILLQPVAELAAGAYRVFWPAPLTVGLVPVKSSVDLVLRALVDPRTVRDAGALIVVSGNYSRSATKYANRAFSYVQIEAGHIAQNIHLSSVEQGLATVEIGGFVEAEMAAALCLDEACIPVVSVAIGEERKGPPPPPLGVADIVRRVVEEDPSDAQYCPPFRMVFAQAYDRDDPAQAWSCGRSPDPELATTKAIAECVEWFACGEVEAHNLLVAKWTEVRASGASAVHPHRIHHYGNRRFAKTHRVEPFIDDYAYEWVRTVDVDTGEAVLVLADFVFFPYTPRLGRRFAFGNSSGVAAHPCGEAAFEHALLELVERDAFMIMWLNRLAPRQIVRRSLPSEIQSRLAAIEAHGFRVTMSIIGLDLAPVMLVSSWSTEPPSFLCAAACAFDLEVAVDRALMELEASVFCFLRDGPTCVPIRVEEVISPLDHARLYEQRQSIRRAKFLQAPRPEGIEFGSVDSGSRPRSIDEMLHKLREEDMHPLVVDLSRSSAVVSATGYEVVRVIVPGLVGMPFGAGLEPLGLPRVVEAPVRAGLRRVGRSPARLNTFPHPFS